MPFTTKEDKNYHGFGVRSIEFDVMQEFVEGSRLLLTGKVQTLKDFQSGRLLVYILADFVAVSEKAVEQDEAAVRGVIANKPTYRERIIRT